MAIRIPLYIPTLEIKKNMGKIIAAFNMTIDGNCDHRIPNPDQEVHEHYADLLKRADVILYGRKTFELMKYWQNLIDEPSDVKSRNDFAESIDKIPKIVFSNTMLSTGWDSAKLAGSTLYDQVIDLKEQGSKVILVGSRSLIIQLLNLNLIDEFQLCIFPIIAGPGLQLFENINSRTDFTLQYIKRFNSGAVIHYYSKSILNT